MRKFIGDFSFIGTINKKIDYLLILNWRINHQLLNIVKNNAKHVVFSDRATHLLHCEIQNAQIKPNMIVGDIKSVHPQLLLLIDRLGIKIYQDHDKNTNEYQKALKKIVELDKGEDIIVSVMGGFGPRMDQALANLSTTQKFSNGHKNLQIFHLDDNSLIYCLKPNQEYIIKQSKLQEKHGCGLIPFGKANVNTKGLKWNLGSGQTTEELQFGRFISSSNQVVQEQVSIVSSNELFWTTTINLLKL